MLHLAGITEIIGTLQRITRDRTRALLFLLYEKQLTNDFADPVLLVRRSGGETV